MKGHHEHQQHKTHINHQSKESMQHNHESMHDSHDDTPTEHHSSHSDHDDHSSHSDHDAHAGHSVSMFKSKFWVSLALTVPVLIYTDMIQHWLRFTPPSFPGSSLIPFIFSTILFYYGGLVFIKSAKHELAAKKPGMMTLISMAISVAFVYSVAVQFGLSGEPFFWELATLITIMLLGHWLEIASIAKAESALDAIRELLPDTAEKVTDNRVKTIKVNELTIGDEVLVRPGSRIPADGTIVKGTSSVNEAAITGESQSVKKEPGSEVIAGTINEDGALTIRVEKVGETTALAGIMRLVAEAQASKSNVQVLADKAAFLLTFVALIAAMLTFTIWGLTTDLTTALERTVTVLIIACPHALGLAIPLVISISTALSAKNGLLVRKRLALEAARNIDSVLFDKTGTLTKGEHGVTDIWPAKGYSEEAILHLTASLEQNSEHIVGKGIMTEAKRRHIHLDELENFQALPGLGVRGTLHGHDNFVAASRRYVDEQKLKVPSEIEANTKKAAEQGKTEVYLIDGTQKVIGAIALADEIRDESYTAVASLKKLGITPAMITGDSKQVARYVAEKLGIETVIAEVRPEDKAHHVQALQKGGKKVAMVGDGINDAPALTQADIGIAIGGGTDVAIKSADIILTRSNPQDVVKVINLSKGTYRKMVQNLVWGAGYNVLAIPLAAGVLYQQGIILAPAVGAVLMSLSTVVVALNAQLLRRLPL